MSDNLPDLPVTGSDAAFLAEAGLDPMKMSMGLAIFMKPGLYNHCKGIALRMSEAHGVIGEHLIGKPSACMAILSRAITWNLDPFAVAQSTYAVKGKIGYEGKLVQAILENSGQLEGRVTYEFFGDWPRLRGKFEMQESGREGKKAVAKWEPEEEEGLGIIVRAQVKGETAPREEEFFLAEMWPRNSTLWATRPKQQMIYASVRAFANIACPGILMGIPFDVQAEDMVDVTPGRPLPSEFQRAPERENPELGDWVAKVNFTSSLGELAQLRKDGLAALPPDLHARFEEVCDSNARRITANAPPQIAQQEGDQGDVDKKVEAPEQSEDLKRGLDVLSRVTKAEDIEDLFGTISADLSADELKVWRKACDDKKAELKKAAKPGSKKK